MRSGDLTDLILPLVSIDEYESKIDSDAVVVAFYVTDKDAADDLNRFIQRSPVEILDSDISPAPDQNGHFMVFVEMLNNKTAVENILAIAEEVSPLCNIDAWDAQIRGEDDVKELSSETLAAALQRNKQHDRSQQSEGAPSVREGLIEALTLSDLERVVVLDNGVNSLVCLDAFNGEGMRYAVVALGDAPTVLSGQVQAIGSNLTFESVTTTNRVRRLLGPNWDVQALGDMQLWRRNDDVCVLVRPLV